MTKTEREQFYDDVIITAVEGGINYWAMCKQYQWSDDGPTSVLVTDPEDEDMGWLKVDRDTIRDAYDTLNAGPVHNLHDWFRAELIGAWIVNDAGEIDAEGADVLVQMGLFGEVVCG